MRSIIFILFFQLISVLGFSKSEVYSARYGLVVLEYDYLNKIVVSSSKEVIPPNTYVNKFGIAEDGNGYIITVLKFDTSGYKESINKNELNSYQVSQFDKFNTLNKPTNGKGFKYFYISKAIFDENFQLVPSVFQATGGVITLPFKYRPNSKLFTSDFSFGTSGGVQIKTNRFATNSISALLAIGMTSVNLDSLNVPNSNQETLTNRSAISFGTGVNASFQGLNIGLFIGKDCLVPKNTIGWIDNGKLWWSLGIGINIFKREIGVATNGKQ